MSFTKSNIYIDQEEHATRLREFLVIREDVERPEAVLFNRLRQVKESDYLELCSCEEQEGGSLRATFTNVSAINYRYGDPYPEFNESELRERVSFLEKHCGINADLSHKVLREIDRERTRETQTASSAPKRALP